MYSVTGAILTRGSSATQLALTRDGMSDEPKKRRGAWIWWPVVLLIVLYPLSVGPAMWLVTSPALDKTVSTIYAPIFWLVGRSDWAASVVEWYLHFWLH
jgi:hypothetical protein